jgi:hypothetical protein
MIGLCFDGLKKANDLRIIQKKKVVFTMVMTKP